MIDRQTSRTHGAPASAPDSVCFQFREFATHNVSVRLLGPPRMRCAETQLESRISAQTMLVFALLVTRLGETLNRDEVAFTLWPDSTEGEARAALRRHLYKLHQALPASPQPWLVCDAKTITWAPNTETWVDVVEFERLCETPATLESAARLYRGDFAPYVDHDWASEIRERLRRRACRVFEDVVAQRRGVGDIRGALYYVEQLLAHDPWREDALRTFMLLRYSIGDRAGALSYYRVFRERLRSEFDVDPMPETLRCFDTIARGLVAES